MTWHHGAGGVNGRARVLEFVRGVRGFRVVEMVVGVYAGAGRG